MDANFSLAVFGCGGHAKVVIDAAERQGIRNIIIADDAEKNWDMRLMGYYIAGGRNCLVKSLPVIVAIGNNEDRMQIADWFIANNFSLATIIHPSSELGYEVKIGIGTFLAAGTVINSGTVAGEHVIVNTGATVDHDCIIGNGVHIAPGAHLCGQVEIGAGSLIGAGAVVIPQMKIGVHCVIGAGSVVIDHIPDGAVVAGNPARPLRPLSL